MSTFSQADGDVLVYTYKHGVLSAVAHDLKLCVTSWNATVDDAGAVQATLDARSLRVITAMRDGAESALLPRLVYGEIEKNIEVGILRARNHPEIRFTSTSLDARAAIGVLELCGRKREVRIALAQEGEAIVGRVRIDQREFTIEPFSAMMGTLKVQPHVDIEVRVRLDRLPDHVRTLVSTA